MGELTENQSPLLAGGKARQGERNVDAAVLVPDIYLRGANLSHIYEKLPLPLLGTTKKVSLQQFAEMTEPIKRMGKNEQIRDYACVFYVKVWDFTPETAKTRWKKAEGVIKGSFYTYEVQEDPW